MKKLLFLGMILISSWLNAQDYYYYYDGKKVHLEPEQNAYCITAKRQTNFDNGQVKHYTIHQSKVLLT